MLFMSIKSNKKFEENYFKGWYKQAVGNFSAKDLELSRRWFWSWLKKLNYYIPIEEGNNRKVLEIGCSIGGVTSLLSQRGFKVWATDVSRFAVKEAKKLTPKATFFVHDIQKPLTLDEKFDLVISFEVVEHLENPGKAIVNMYKVLKAGGTLVISTPFPYKWNFRDPTHINVKYPDEWLKLMRHAGFRNIKFHRFTLLPFFYKFSKQFQIILPFAVPLPYINSPIFFIGRK